MAEPYFSMAEEMAKALKDSSKLVRWRAAMFLYEAGDEETSKASRTSPREPTAR